MGNLEITQIDSARVKQQQRDTQERRVILDKTDIFTKLAKHGLKEQDVCNDPKFKELMETRNKELSQVVGSNDKYDTAKWAIGGAGTGASLLTSAFMGIGECGFKKTLGVGAGIAAIAGGLFYLVDRAQEKREEKPYKFSQILPNKYDTAKWAIGGAGTGISLLTSAFMGIGECSFKKTLGVGAGIAALAGGLFYLVDRAQGKKEDKINNKYRYLAQERVAEMIEENKSKISNVQDNPNSEIILTGKASLTKEQRRELGFNSELDWLSDTNNNAELEIDNKKDEKKEKSKSFIGETWNSVKDFVVNNKTAIALTVGIGATAAIMIKNRHNISEFFKNNGKDLINMTNKKARPASPYDKCM